MRISFEIDTQEDFEKLRAFFATTQWTGEERREEEALPLSSPSSLPPYPYPITPYNPPLPEEENREEETQYYVRDEKKRGELKPHGFYGNVWLSDKEVNKLHDKFGFNKMQDMIENMDWYIGEDPARQKKYAKRNHYLTLLNWERKNQKRQEKQPTLSFRDVVQKGMC